MSSALSDHSLRAALLALFAVGAASIQDAIVKHVSDIYPVTETVMIRCLTSLPVLAFMLWRAGGFTSLATPYWRVILLRSLVLCSAYFAFVMAFAAMPLANAVSIYFTMPFFVAGLSGPFLHERVPVHRWIAIALGFAGVLIMVRPGLFSCWLCRGTDAGAQRGAERGAHRDRQLAEHRLSSICHHSGARLLSGGADRGPS
jgi:drug/metabolite transporter (DMT)-like permease